LNQPIVRGLYCLAAYHADAGCDSLEVMYHGRCRRLAGAEREIPMQIRLFLAPLLHYLQGAPLERGPLGQRVSGRLAASMHSTIGLEEYVRVRLVHNANGECEQMCIEGGVVPDVRRIEPAFGRAREMARANFVARPPAFMPSII